MTGATETAGAAEQPESRPAPAPAPQPMESGGIRRSKTFKEITKAMIKFQSEIKLVPKGTANPFFSSKYADLGAIWNEIRKPLSANSLMVTHGVKSEGRTVNITTLVVHVSGEWMETDIEMEAKNLGAQAVGSVITYGKRYGISALLNVVSEGEDDDGEGAEGRGGDKGAAAKKQPDKAQAAKPPKSKATPPNGPAVRREWQWAKKAPVWDPKAKKYKCSNCAKHCETKVSTKTGTHITYCDCRFAYDWEAEVPEPYKRKPKEKQDAGVDAAPKDRV